MTPELSAALRTACTQCGSDVNLADIAPIIDAAITEAASTAAATTREVVEKCARYDALLAAADDADRRRLYVFGAPGGEGMNVGDWLRARANEGNPQ